MHTVVKTTSGRTPEQLKNSRRQKTTYLGICLVVILLVLLASLTVNVLHNPFWANFDQYVLNQIRSIRTTSGNIIFDFITFLANWQSVLVAYALIVGIFLKRRYYAITIVFLLGAAGSHGSTLILKNLLARSRPDQVFRLIAENSWSFPSGHTVAATYLFGALSYFLFKATKSKFKKLVVASIGIMSLVLVGLSRIYLGIHYVSDVLGGIFMGLIWLIPTLLFYQTYCSHHADGVRPLAKNKLLFIVPLVLVIFSALFHNYFVPISI